MLAAHADHLAALFQCGGGGGGATLPRSQLLAFARSQTDYILGAIVGYDAKFPEQVHYRGALMSSIKSSPRKITCKGGFVYYSKDAPNLIVIVGGPDGYDWYEGIARGTFIHMTLVHVTLSGLEEFFGSAKRLGEWIRSCRRGVFSNLPKIQGLGGDLGYSWRCSLRLV
jgi:hypothetical protein